MSGVQAQRPLPRLSSVRRRGVLMAKLLRSNFAKYKSNEYFDFTTSNRLPSRETLRSEKAKSLHCVNWVGRSAVSVVGFTRTCQRLNSDRTNPSLLPRRNCNSKRPSGPSKTIVGNEDVRFGKASFINQGFRRSADSGANLDCITRRAICSLPLSGIGD